MRKSFPVWVIFIISAITVFSRLNSIVKDRGRIQNFQITSLVQYIPFSTESNFNRLFSEDSVSLSRDTGGFIARYSFPKTLLLKKIHLIPHFIFSKVKNYVVFFKYEDLVGIFLAFITPFILGIPILLTTPITKKRISTIFSKHKYFILLICAYILTHIP